MSTFIQEVISLTDFQKEVLESELPVVVDFWAPWCGPCRVFAPTFEGMAAECVGKAKFVKVNTDEAQELAVKYGITSIPTVIVFKDGKELTRQKGAQTQGGLRVFVSRCI